MNQDRSVKTYLETWKTTWTVLALFYSIFPSLILHESLMGLIFFFGGGVRYSTPSLKIVFMCCC